MLHWGRTKSDGIIDLSDVSVEARQLTDERIAYLHVGAHKTGTTSLQNLIRENARQLYQQGVFPLARSFPILPGFSAELSYQRDFVRRLRLGVRSIELRQKPRTLRKLRKLMLGMTASAPHLLVSEEGLLGRRLGAESTLYPQAASYLMALTSVFRGYRPVVMIYIRQQTKFIESNYLHSVKTGESRSFREYVDALNLDGMRWTPVVESIVRVCGTENVVVRPFESIKQGFIPFAERFFQTFSDSSRLDIREVVANPGLSSLGVEVSRFLAPRVGAERWGLLRQPVQRLLSNKYLPAVELFDARERELLDSRFRADYEQALKLGRR